MRILYYLPSLFNSGGTERITTLKANYLAEQRGYEVIILTSEQQGHPPYFPLSDKIRTADLGVCFDSNNSPSRLLKLLNYPFKYYSFKRKFSKALYQYAPDITITTLRRELYFIHSIRDGSAKVGEFHYTRSAYTSSFVKGSNFLIRLVNKYWEKFFIRHLNKLSKVVLLTNSEKQIWPELNNAFVVPNPLAFFPATASGCEEKKVISVGRYVFDKGFDMLIDVWKIVHQRHKDWKLYIYGSGYKESLNDQISSLRLNDSCFLEEPVKNIEEKYLGSSIFALCSRHEGFGMVIAEAMACGVPPVSFNCPGGPRDIIQDGIDGILVEHEDINQMAQKICYLIENRNIRVQIGKQAKINIQRFKLERVMEQWMELFNSLKK
ncbi:MAG: glycosyltransferase family 4 protein [Mangrovibacterium sp.]